MTIFSQSCVREKLDSCECKFVEEVYISNSFLGGNCALVVGIVMPGSVLQHMHPAELIIWTQAPSTARSLGHSLCYCCPRVCECACAWEGRFWSSCLLPVKLLCVAFGRPMGDTSVHSGEWFTLDHRCALSFCRCCFFCPLNYSSFCHCLSSLVWVAPAGIPATADTGGNDFP